MKLRKRFKISKIIVDDDIIFNWSTISQDQDGNILMSMESTLSKIKYEPDVASLRADTGRRATTMEAQEYCELAGEMIWI